MAHEIQYWDSQVGIDMAWHKLTTVVPEVNRDNCRILYPMCLKPLFWDKDGEPQSTGFNIIVAEDNNRQIGEPVSDKYSLVSNSQIWDAVELALGNTSHQIVSVGTVCDRSRGFISIKLSDKFMAASRDTESVLNVIWGHGGVLPVIARTGITVVVCNNTFNMALSRRGDFNFRVKHIGDTEVKLDNMCQALDAHFRTVEQFQAEMDKLAQQSISAPDANRFFAGFVVDEAPKDNKVSTRSQNMYNELYNLFHSGKGNHGRDLSDVFNSVTDFYTHGAAESKVDMPSRFESSEFGTGATRKVEAFQVLTGAKVPRIGSYNEVIQRGETVLQMAELAA